LPKFCYVPNPSGFTPEGIPYYNIHSFIHQDGFIMPPLDKAIYDDANSENEKRMMEAELAKENEDELDESGSMDIQDMKTEKEVKKEMTNNLIKKLIKNNKVITKQFNVLRKLYGTEYSEEVEQNTDLDLLSEPTDLLKYIKDIDIGKKEASNKIKFVCEPNVLIFQSVNISMVKTINIKYISEIANDPKEYKYYANVTPSNIFDCPNNIIKIHHDQIIPIEITFNPKYLTNESVNGEFSVINDKGKSYMRCKLKGIKKSYIDVSHESIDMGWIFPNRTFEFPIIVENKSSSSVSLTIRLKHGEYIYEESKESVLSFDNINDGSKGSLYSNSSTISNIFNITSEENMKNNNGIVDSVKNIDDDNDNDILNSGSLNNNNIIDEQNDEIHDEQNDELHDEQNEEIHDEQNDEIHDEQNDEIHDEQNDEIDNDMNNSIDKNNYDNEQVDETNNIEASENTENNNIESNDQKQNENTEYIENTESKIENNTNNIESSEIINSNLDEQKNNNSKSQQNIEIDDDNNSLKQSQNISEKNPFSISVQTLQLNPLERKTIIINFEPKKLGKFDEQLEIYAPGGDIKIVNIKAKCGIPIGIYPEDSKCSKIKNSDLEAERNEIIKVFINNDIENLSNLPNKKDEQIIKSLQLAINDNKYRNSLYTIDFGVFINKEMKKRSLTLMNFTENEMKIGLFSTSHILSFDEFITIPKQCSKVVDININFGYYHNKDNFKGIISEKIELLCPGIDNIILNVKGYVGQPLLFPSWDLCFFTPCQINSKSSLNMPLINHSQYDLGIILKFPREERELNFITSSLSTDSNFPSLIKAFSTIPISFSFNAKERGLTLKQVIIKIVKPFKKEVSCGLTEKGINLIGICLYPYHKKGSTEVDYNSLEFISSWLSHPRRILDEFPNKEEMKKMFMKVIDDTNYRQLVRLQRTFLIFYSISEQKVENMIDNSKKVVLSNNNEAPIDVSIINSPCFNSNILSRELEKGEEYTVEYYYNPPNKIPKYSTMYGFSLAIEDTTNSFSSMQLIGKNEFDFFVFPCPDENKEINIDFGYVETSSEKEKGISRTIMLCNLYALEYMWNISIIGSKERYCPFSLSLMEGELASNETFPLIFTFNCEVSGTFETSMDLYAMDCTGKYSVKKFIARVNLKGTTICSDISGYPEIIDFGQNVINTNRKIRFKIDNKGNNKVNVNMAISKPFSVNPNKFILDLDESREVEVIYDPKIPGCSTKNLIIYANKRQINIPVKGIGGSFELICKKYPESINFGWNRNDSIVWINCYLTNIGTIPLLLKGITSENYNLFRVEYINNVNTIPNIKDDDERYITKDYWQVAKNNLKNIINSEDFFNFKYQSMNYEINENEEKKFLFQRGTSIPVTREIDNKIIINPLNETIPQLDSFSSYHLRIGFICHYKTTISSLNFHYYPVIPYDNENQKSNISSILTIKTIGKSYRNIHFSSLNYSFPYIPAKCFIDDSNGTRQEFNEYKHENDIKNDPSIYNMIISNLDIETQNISLTGISTEFKIDDKRWLLGPGEQVTVPIKFEPINEQTHYKGKAIFKHNHGYTTVFLSGTGASADIYCEKLLDFETAKVKTNVIKYFKIHNRGLLGCKYTLQIYCHNQISPFTFKDKDDPYDIEGYIDSSEKLEIPIICCCSNSLASSILLMKWQRIPNGVWETETIELKVEIGQPKFEIDRKEINFETTYVNIKKTITISILNSGNANCNWMVHNYNPEIIFEPSEGIIEPDEIFEIEVSFNPKSFNPLNDTVRFETDSGDNFVLVTGIIGVPYLKLDSNDIDKDFGVVEIEKYSTNTITLNNTGSKPLKFFTSIINHKINGIDFEKNEYDVFFFKQSKGVIKPNSSVQLNIICFPVEYGANITAEYIIFSNNGEKCFGNLSCVGGKARIEIIAINNKDFKLKVNETSNKGFNKNKLCLALTSHIKLIKNVIEDIVKTEDELRVEEEEFMKEQLKNPLKKRQFQLMKNKKEKTTFKMKKSLNLNGNTNIKQTESNNKNNDQNDINKQEILQTEEQQLEDENLLEVEKMNKKISIPENLLEIYIKTGQIPNIYDNSSLMNDYILLHKMNIKNKNEIPKTQDVRAFFEYINSNIDIVTRECIMKIKELGNSKWIKNKELLVKDLKLIQKSSFAIKEIINPIKLCDDTKINTYSLGIIKGSTHLKNISLFKMVNNGNMDFDFNIIDNVANSMKPLDYNPNNQPFSINPNNSIIGNGTSLNIDISFRASVTGRYEQQFEICSCNKPIASFYVNISVGNPIFSVYPDTIDFGITQINTLSSRTLMIINNGTFSDNFIISSKEENENDIENFIFETKSGQIDCNNEMSVPITFSPKIEGKITETFLLRWLGKPILICLSGVGGEAILTPIYKDQIDIMNECLYFGDAEIGKEYNKEFVIKNYGNVESIFKIEYDENIMDFEMDNFDKSKVKLHPKQEITVRAIFYPQRIGFLTTPIKLIQTNQHIFDIPIQANCGEYKYQLNDIPPLKGIQIDTTATRDVILSNIGTFDIPVNIYLYPSYLESIISIKINQKESHGVKNIKEEFIHLNDEDKIENKDLKLRTKNQTKKYTAVVLQNGKLNMTLTFKSDICGLMKGALAISDVIGDKPLELPLRFVVYKDEICLEDNSDVDLGRMCINQETPLQQKLINFGNEKIKYRIFFRNEKFLEEQQQKDKKKKVSRKGAKIKNDKNSKSKSPDSKQSSNKTATPDSSPIWRITSPNSMFFI